MLFRSAFVAVWVLAAAALLALYVAQELLEELFATGHPSGVAGVFGHGGWWAIPLSLFFSAVVAACVGVADDLVEFAASILGSRVFVASVPAVRPSLGSVRMRGLAFVWQGRGPPVRRTFAA